MSATLAILEHMIGQTVVAKTEAGAFVAVGKIVAYRTHPSVKIERQDGTSIWWAAHLVEAPSEQKAPRTRQA